MQVHARILKRDRYKQEQDDKEWQCLIRIVCFFMMLALFLSIQFMSCLDATGRTHPCPL